MKSIWKAKSRVVQCKHSVSRWSQLLCSAYAHMNSVEFVGHNFRTFSKHRLPSKKKLQVSSYPWQKQTSAFGREFSGTSFWRKSSSLGNSPHMTVQHEQMLKSMLHKKLYQDCFELWKTSYNTIRILHNFYFVIKVTPVGLEFEATWIANQLSITPLV